jgi:hypothetical protein
MVIEKSAKPDRYWQVSTGWKGVEIKKGSE